MQIANNNQLKATNIKLAIVTGNWFSTSLENPTCANMCFHET